MRTFILSFLGGLAALVLFFIVLPLALVISFLPSAPPPKQVVLELDLRDGMNDQPATDSLGAIFNSSPSFVETILKLDAAAGDDLVKGVYVRAPEMELGSSRAEELRAAFRKLRSKGKFVIAHSQGFFAAGPSAYRAIAGADEVWLQPGASFEAPGVAFETLFMGKLLEKFKVSADMVQFYEYKNAVDTFKQNGYTKPHAEAMTALAQSVWTASLADIAEDRKSTPQAIEALLEATPFTADETLKAKLVDKLGWPEEAAATALTRAGLSKDHLVKVADYSPRPQSGKATIAIVGGEGDILTGESGGGDLLSAGAPAFASDAVSRRILELAEDDSVTAVVFRVDSGGGSATASDQIWRAVARLKEKKKVVVSMGSMAASGGYYVSAGADAIVADKSTITGSIGVFGGKFAIGDGLREFGINPASVSVGGDYATAYSSDRMSPTQKAALTRSLEDVYVRFTTLVSQGRKLPIERVREIAKGRIWSGADAKAIGLVDETGGLMVAIDKARQLAGLKPEDKVTIRLDAPRGRPIDLIMQAFSAKATSEQRQAFAVMTGLAGRDRTAAMISQLRRLVADPTPQVWAPRVVER